MGVTLQHLYLNQYGISRYLCRITRQLDRWLVSGRYGNNCKAMDFKQNPHRPEISIASIELTANLFMEMVPMFKQMNL